MKKQLLTVIAAGAFTGSMFAQLPVSTLPQNRKAVLEEFTGIHCQYCPDGHRIANQIKAAHTAGDVVLINVHTGGYATPGAGEPDYRTTEGNVIVAMPGMNLAGYPMGAVNRHLWTGTAMAEDRNYWSTHISTCLTQTSPVNVALQGTVDVNTRVLSLECQVYYTANSSTGTNSLTIALLEDWVAGPQTSGSIWYPAMMNTNGTYNHNHMLRKVLTAGNFGIPVSPTTAGSSFTTTITYTVPATFGSGSNINNCNINNIHLVAFVADDYKEIRTAAEGPLQFNGLPNVYDISLNFPPLQTPPNTFVTDQKVCAAKFNSQFQFHNMGSSTATNVVFGYFANGGTPMTYTWTGSVLSQQQSNTIVLPVYSFPAVASNVYSLTVLSVNGNTDGDASNSDLIRTVAKTITAANDMNMQMDFYQDMYGYESTWTIYDESNMSVVAYDGPFPGLGSVGTQLNSKPFNVTPNACYLLKVDDTGGNGINGAGGAGYYSLKSNGVQIIYSGGTYGAGEIKYYFTPINLGIANAATHISNVNIYPNPAGSSANLSIELSQNETISVVVLNNIGQVVYSQNSQTLDAGTHNISLNTGNFASGLYNVNVSTSNGTINKKLTVTK